MLGTVTAPQDLELPHYVRSRLGRRTSFVLDHRFTAESIGVDWWNRQFERHGLEQSVQVFEHGSFQRLTRSDPFRMGPDPLAHEDAILTLLWHVLAWGTGPSQRLNELRIRAFERPDDRLKNTDLLKRAAQLASKGQPSAAYRWLIRRGGGQISNLWPTFFTKFLYFASEGTMGTRCLILDARVASRLAEAGWHSLPHRGQDYSYNWYTDTYASYCDLLTRWASAETSTANTLVFPDEIERALFSSEDEQ